MLLAWSPAHADPRLGDRAPEIPGVATKGVVVVDFFATWCGPCQEAMVALDQVLSRVGGVRLIVVDVGESAEVVRSFFKAHPLPRGGELVIDSSGELSRRFGQHRFPTTFLVGDGTIRHINRGVGPGYAARIEKWLRAMLITE